MLNQNSLIDRGRRSRRLARLVVASLIALPATLLSQSTRGGLAGRLTDTVGTPISGVVVHVVGTSYGGVSDGAGRYRVEPIASGSYVVSLRRLGFASDTFSVTIGSSVVTMPDRVLRSAAAVLAGVVDQGVAAAQRDAGVGARQAQSGRQPAWSSSRATRFDRSPTRTPPKRWPACPASRRNATRVKESSCRSVAPSRASPT